MGLPTLPMIREILTQVFKTPATNPFPSRFLPKSVTGFLKKVAAGEAAIHPPVQTPPNFRGKIVYDRDGCIGCNLCLKVCPAHAIEIIPETKRVRIFVAQCVFCSQCTDICPKGVLSMSDEFLLATEDRFAESQIVE
ncbi:MAG: 4Fe-4S dicluster domain-containing protein [Methanocalculus sp. MSAO_Arc1]|uniref:4Fe-4S dicluster domain-containing protein n=1 Tax=Methanocalculus TaxID=71151 RepID=UPI000FF35098|nr:MULTISPECIES: 4Fe-4S dicluster domain-containing protein [unclassified Methanocalculus]MCP1662799.1 formate hydrogenlyase subunit 6/NADH:ubiquinone oxidoreductase subunit I [Methanocalculus sp. AMF5]RQD81060.1 MAG: 4Fe-4S dicluster domain-containing protein [Methanocalculus sp. MSAO_Arc1]